MNKAKVAITIEEPTLKRIDRLVEAHVFSNRSQAIAAAVGEALERLERLERGHLARECAKLDPAFERRIAEEGIAEELDEWPEYSEATSAGPISIPAAVMSRRAGGRWRCSVRIYSISAPARSSLWH